MYRYDGALGLPREEREAAFGAGLSTRHQQIKKVSGVGRGDLLRRLVWHSVLHLFHLRKKSGNFLGEAARRGSRLASGQPRQRCARQLRALAAVGRWWGTGRSADTPEVASAWATIFRASTMSALEVGADIRRPDRDVAFLTRSGHGQASMQAAFKTSAGSTKLAHLRHAFVPRWCGDFLHRRGCLRRCLRLANKDIVHHIEHAHTDVLRRRRERAACNVVRASESPCCQRLFMVTRLNS